MNLTAWRAWRRTHYADGTPRREGELGSLMEHMLSTRKGAIAVRRADRRYAKQQRAQHTAPHPARAWWLRIAYGRKRRAQS